MAKDTHAPESESQSLKSFEKLKRMYFCRMKHLFILTLLQIALAFRFEAQYLEGTEIGIDGSLSGSNLGGAAACGIKFGFKTSENFSFGPSIRFNRAWSTPTYASQKFSFTNWGAGIFAHARYGNVVFGGIEAELIQNKNIFVDTNAIFKRTIPTVFICGGFSKELSGFVRLNFGLYFDLINALNSPYRNAYLITIKDPQTGQIVRRLPIIYRLTFFFPLPYKKKGVSPEDETPDH